MSAYLKAKKAHNELSAKLKTQKKEKERQRLINAFVFLSLGHKPDKWIIWNETSLSDSKGKLHELSADELKKANERIAEITEKRTKKTETTQS